VVRQGRVLEPEGGGMSYRKSILTIKFCEGKFPNEGHNVFYILTNKGSLDEYDLSLFGQELFNYKGLSKADKFALKEFCKQYIKSYETEKLKEFAKKNHIENPGDFTEKLEQFIKSELPYI